ncbi:MAG: hypothetical protein ACVCEJ_07325 [Candidatus Izemoplasmataceae bacterium]
MLPTILLVFPLALLYVWLTFINKKTTSKETPTDYKERCAYCDISHSIH